MTSNREKDQGLPWAVAPAEEEEKEEKKNRRRRRKRRIETDNSFVHKYYFRVRILDGASAYPVTVIYM
jgi:hypothetical protein